MPVPFSPAAINLPADQPLRLQQMTPVNKFNLYVVAETQDTQNGANKIYAEEAIATGGWTFDGSSASIGPQQPYIWRGVAQHAALPTAWGTPPTPGQAIDYSGVWFNALLRMESWNKAG